MKADFGLMQRVRGSVLKLTRGTERQMTTFEAVDVNPQKVVSVQVISNLSG